MLFVVYCLSFDVYCLLLIVCCGGYVFLILKMTSYLMTLFFSINEQYYFIAKYHFNNRDSVLKISRSCQKKHPNSLIIHGDVDTIVPHVCIVV